MLKGTTADPIIRRLVQWGQARPDVRAMILTSTLTSPLAHVDLFSDYDIIVVVADIAPYMSDAWLDHFGQVLVLYRDPVRLEFGLPRFARITQYEDGLKIDFTLWPVGMMAHVIAETERAGGLDPDLDGGYTVLLDKDGSTAALPPPTYKAYIPVPPTEAAYREVVREFFHEATYAAKYLWRGELMPIKYFIDQAMKQDDLRVMLEWRMEMGHGWAVKPGAYGKWLERYLPPDIWRELEATYVGPGIEQNWEAMFATIALFRRVAREVGAHLGYAYPDAFDERMMAYLQGVRMLDREA